MKNHTCLNICWLAVKITLGNFYKFLFAWHILEFFVYGK